MQVLNAIVSFSLALVEAIAATVEVIIFIFAIDSPEGRKIRKIKQKERKKTFWSQNIIVVLILDYKNNAMDSENGSLGLLLLPSPLKWESILFKSFQNWLLPALLQIIIGGGGDGGEL